MATKDELIATYCLLVNEGKYFPTKSDMSDAGFTINMLKHHFKNISGLRAAAKESNPEFFKGVIEDPRKYHGKSTAQLKGKRRFMFTCVVNGHAMFDKALDTVKSWSKKHDGQLVLLPSISDYNKKVGDFDWQFDAEATKLPILFQKYSLNKSFHVTDFIVGAKQINPLTGIQRMVQESGSFIFGSPKQFLEYFPTSNNGFPSAGMSTGAITLPNYKQGNFKNRQSWIANHDHVMGAVIVEIEDNELYHFRQVEFDENGGFCDLGYYYRGNNRIHIDSILTMGDYHAGDHDDEAVETNIRLSKEVGTTTLVLNDFYNGEAVNPHQLDNIIERSINAKQYSRISLVAELEVCGVEIKRLLKTGNKLVFVKSNHDEFLDRYIKTLAFKNDAMNFQACCKIADAMIDGRDALVEGLRLFGNIKDFDKLIKNGTLTFLGRDDDFKVLDIQLGAHGDLGLNGHRKPNKLGIERAYGAAVVGHSHTAGILRRVFQVGTSSKKKLSYNRGVSTWMHTSCLTYANGHRQLINSIHGRYTIGKIKSKR